VKARLESFRYIPREPTGWHTNRLEFGELITVVQGANGSGKTPIMKGILHGLGHQVELPPAILSHCVSAEVTVKTDQHQFVLTRSLENRFNLRVSGGETDRVFENEGEYARWFQEALGLEPRQVVTKANESSELYVNLLAPAFFVDQDHGWTTAYWTPPNRNFVRDQRQEIIRYLVGLPPRHQLNERNKYEDAKDALTRAQKAVELQRFVVERLRSNEGLDENEEAELSARKKQFDDDLEANSDAIEAIRSVASQFDRDIWRLEEQQEALAEHKDKITKRKGQLELVFAELEGEEEILAANVQATDIFHQFCGRADCEMFPASSRSFGRSLLFLKDQLKDLRSSDRSLAKELVTLEKKTESIEVAIQTKRDDRRRTIEASPHAEISHKISGLTSGLVEVELRLAKIRQYSTEQRKFARLLAQLEQAEDLVNQLRPGRGKTLASSDDVRHMLADSMQAWLKSLGTSNTSVAEFDQDFDLFVDGELFSETSHQSGSTRTRIVLAFHAALLEVALARNGNHPGWLCRASRQLGQIA
jgi:hypothetical protein